MESFIGGASTFHQSIINPLNTNFGKQKIISGPISSYRLDERCQKQTELAEKYQEKYKDVANAVMEKVIYGTDRIIKRDNRLVRVEKDVQRLLKKIGSQTIEKPVALLSLYEDLMSHHERVLGPSSKLACMEKSEKCITRERLNDIVTRIRFQLMRSFEKKNYPKLEYQILSVLYFLQDGWPGVFKGNEFLQKHLPVKKELQSQKFINLNRLSKCTRSVKTFFEKEIFSKENEKNKFLNIVNGWRGM
jgi:hypothetical protein